MTDNVTPQPGAVKGNYVPNGLPKKDVTNPKDPSWPILPALQAPNFVNAEPMLVTFGVDKTKPGAMLTLLPFRVWGEPAWDIGRYWTLGKPSSQADFYGKCAVQLDWNGGGYVCMLNNPGAALTVKAWSGLVARQPAAGTDANGHIVVPLPGYYLPGGWNQVYVPDGTLPFIQNGRTAWNPKQVQATAALGVAAAAPAAGNGADYERLTVAVNELAAQIEALDRQTNRDGGQAQVLRRRMQAVHADLPHAASDARERVRLVLWSLVATGRLADRELSAAEHPGAFDHAVNEVVDAAYKLAHSLD